MGQHELTATIERIKELEAEQEDMYKEYTKAVEAHRFTIA